MPRLYSEKSTRKKELTFFNKMCVLNSLSTKKISLEEFKNEYNQNFNDQFYFQHKNDSSQLNSSNTTTYQSVFNEISVNNQWFNQKRIKKTKWSKDEDESLLKLVKMYGPRKWNIISVFLGTKTAKQCRDHYMNYLNPSIKKTIWTDEEESILLLKYQQFGPKWSIIKQFFPGRTSAMIKNYTQILLKEFEKAKIDDNISDVSHKIEKSEFNLDDINSLLNRPESFVEVI